MKSWFNYLLMACLALTMLAACEKDEDRLILAESTTLALTSSATSVSLNSGTATNEALRLSWTPADYGFSAAVTYTVQLDKQGGTFEAPVNISAGSSTSLSVTGATLNQSLLRLGLAPNNAGQFAVRVMAAIARPSSDPSNMVYSNAATVSATPYLVIVDYPSLYVPGDYQGWTPATAPRIASVKDNKVYEGYIYFSKASPFKITSAPNWDNTNYGTGGTGKLSTTGGDLTIAEAGYYLVKADLTALTWSATKTTWSVIGAATPGGWDTDSPLTFNPATNTWTATLDLKAGELKFRANNAWDINYGDGDSKNGAAADGLLDFNADNIAVSTAGRYLVTLNLSNAGNYIYTLTRQ
ncbi:SusE domain-containing protein [Spirosoma sp. KUDC1026]|uniref:SusE domain-containing protein n=1 Tax=Spirosoma sp. KUDC1026 TaxID=2745947 RepID=UPI00159BE3B7|nr:SusE domain-containing protein [Spirosoma sp. KUDC1026]QKZ13216.1 SusE domain-containing protein [Spirosoma sp. KUDC1026]